MSESVFVGRKQELELLTDLRKKNSASLVVIYGRRRIGKSRLAEEFGRHSKFYSFEGLYPEQGTTDRDQLNAFYERFLSYFSSKQAPFTDWLQAFNQLAKKNKKGKVVILLDEISWMGAHDANFLGKLKTAWDLEFKKNSNLVLILCGSVSSWIEKRLLAHKGFYGRISIKLRLQEQPLSDCNKYWLAHGATISSYEKFKILSVTGGIPKYLEEINPSQSAEENIRKLCFTPTGILFNDYSYIFSSTLERDSDLYQKIVQTLCRHNLLRNEVLASINKQSGGLLTSYIDDLEVAGFIDRDFTWNLKTGDLSKISQYRLSDNYIRFYMKYIMPVAPKVKSGRFSFSSLGSLPGWSSIMGLQIENLILNNRSAVLDLMGIYQDEVICDGPFFQRKTAKIQGCQIDYLVQTKLGVLYLCEVKFTRTRIHTKIINEMQEKIKRLSVPKRLSIVPVLLYMGDIQDEVIDSQFFGRVINIEQLLGE
jgi:predicted AAA+ superfamily ATPase